jgi:dUTP pyrophosphatase
MINLGSEPVTIRRGDRLAQLVVAKVERPDLEVVEELSSTDRGTGGFGSTG